MICFFQISCLYLLYNINTILISYIRYKKTKSGQTYSYQITASWNPEKKQSRSTSKYLGVLGPDGKVIPTGHSKKGRTKKVKPDPLVLDFGDSFLVEQAIKQSAIYQPLQPLFQQFSNLLPLMIYRLSNPGPMYNADFWLEGNAIKLTQKKFSLASQDISRLLAYLGEESVQRDFFSQYLNSQDKQGPKNIIIDATSLPNQIDVAFNAWGYAGPGVDKQFRFHCVVDQLTKKPLFYRYVPGNLADVASLQVTIQELKELGVNQSFALLDAGYCSQNNINLLRTHHIDFLMRLPAGRKLFKNLVKNYANQLETLEHAIQYGKRSLFVLRCELEDLYGQPGYAYMILDPQRKAKNIQELIMERNNKEAEEIDQEKDQETFSQAGMFALISSKPIPAQEVVQAYYTRQSVEQIFGFAKDDMELLPIRCHKEETIRGYLFLQFLLLVVYLEMRQKLGGHYTVEQALLICRGLKCKKYPEKALVQDLTKHQRDIFRLSSIIVPTFISGI